MARSIHPVANPHLSKLPTSRTPGYKRLHTRRRDERGYVLPAPGVPSREAAAGYASVHQILIDLLRSSAEVTGAEQAFCLVARDLASLELASSWRIHPSDVMETVLTRAPAAIYLALREQRLACTDSQGRTLPMEDDFFTRNSPAVLCLPLDLGARLAGVLCLSRREPLRVVSELDLEIAQALAEQIALAISAASAFSALTHLEQSLGCLPPAHA